MRWRPPTRVALTLTHTPDDQDAMDSGLALVAYNEPEQYKALVKPAGAVAAKGRAAWMAQLSGE